MPTNKILSPTRFQATLKNIISYNLFSLNFVTDWSKKKKLNFGFNFNK